MKDLTREERNAIRSLQRLAKRWPKGLYLFAANGTLWVMRQADDPCATPWEGADPDLKIESVNIPCDGGDR